MWVCLSVFCFLSFSVAFWTVSFQGKPKGGHEPFWWGSPILRHTHIKLSLFRQVKALTRSKREHCAKCHDALFFVEHALTWRYIPRKPSEMDSFGSRIFTCSSPRPSIPFSMESGESGFKRQLSTSNRLGLGAESASTSQNLRLLRGLEPRALLSPTLDLSPLLKHRP